MTNHSCQMVSGQKLETADNWERKLCDFSSSVATTFCENNYSCFMIIWPFYPSHQTHQLSHSSSIGFPTLSNSWWSSSWWWWWCWGGRRNGTLYQRRCDRCLFLLRLCFAQTPLHSLTEPTPPKSLSWKTISTLFVRKLFSPMPPWPIVANCKCRIF